MKLANYATLSEQIVDEAQPIAAAALAESLPSGSMHLLIFGVVDGSSLWEGLVRDCVRLVEGLGDAKLTATITQQGRAATVAEVARELQILALGVVKLAARAPR